MPAVVPMASFLKPIFSCSWSKSWQRHRCCTEMNESKTTKKPSEDGWFLIESVCASSSQVPRSRSSSFNLSTLEPSSPMSVAHLQLELLS